MWRKKGFIVSNWQRKCTLQEISWWKITPKRLACFLNLMRGTWVFTAANRFPVNTPWTGGQGQGCIKFQVLNYTPSPGLLVGSMILTPTGFTFNTILILESSLWPWPPTSITMKIFWFYYNFSPCGLHSLLVFKHISPCLRGGEVLIPGHGVIFTTLNDLAWNENKQIQPLHMKYYAGPRD